MNIFDGCFVYRAAIFVLYLITEHILHVLADVIFSSVYQIFCSNLNYIDSYVLHSYSQLKIKLMKIMKFRNLLLVLIMGFVSPLMARQEANELIERAEFLIQNNRYEDALVMLDQAIEKSPKDVTLYYKKATTYMGMSKFRDAIRTLEKAVEIKPDYFEAHEILGNLYAQYRKATKAVEHYQKAYEAVELEEEKLRFKFEILNILQMVGKDRKTLPHIEDAKKIIGEDNFDLMFFEAVYYNETDQFQKAVEVLEKLIVDVPAVPGNEKYYFNLGLAHHRLGNYTKADEYLKNADNGPYKAQMRQFHPKYYFALANTYYTVYEYGEANNFNDIALAIDPALSEALELQKKLASIKTNKKKIIEAMEAGMKAEKDKNKMLDAQKELILLYYQGGDYQKAVLASKEYVTQRPVDLQVVYMLAVAESKLSMFGEAATDLSKAVQNPRIAPELRASLYFTLGLIYKSEKKWELAEKAFISADSGEFRFAARYEFEQVAKLRSIENEDSDEDTEMTDEESGDDGGKKK